MARVVPLDPLRRAKRAQASSAENPSRLRGDGSALTRLTALVEDDLTAVNNLVLQRLLSRVPLVPQLARHVIAAGGKRLRPLLTLAGARLCGYEGTRHHALAACVEFMHTATLLHDDVVDASTVRRGVPSANALFGNASSVLVGDFLISRAFQMMVEDGSLDVLRILADTGAVIAEGEVRQLEAARTSTLSEQTYLDIIRAKTAELFAASCQIGAVVAGRPAPEEEALRTFGLNLGIAFQIADDVLDYGGEQTLLGKTVGDDFREGKVTLPVILAIHRGNEAERAFWRRTMEEQDRRPEDLLHAQRLLQAREALRDSLERAHHYGAMARDALGLFPDTPLRRVLLDLVDFAVDRDF